MDLRNCLNFFSSLQAFENFEAILWFTLTQWYSCTCIYQLSVKLSSCLDGALMNYSVDDLQDDVQEFIENISFPKAKIRSNQAKVSMKALSSDNLRRILF